MHGFTLRKSYLDVVDGEGRCAIAYSADLTWGPLALQWEALSLHQPGQPVTHRSAWTARRRRAGDSDSACAPDRMVGGYTVRATCEPWCPAYAATLLQEPSGTLEWSCDAPGAEVAIECGDGVVIEGAGYSERLVLSMLPWTLPIDELRWGRWHSAVSRRSIVWIDWQGERPLTLLLENGAMQQGATVSDQAIAWGGKVLHLESSGALYSRTLAEIIGVSGPLINRLPASWRRLEDRKHLSRGILGAESGWAIHEMVRFP